MKICFSLVALAAGLGSAWFWFRSSQVSFSTSSARDVFVNDQPVVTGEDIQKYLADVASLNTIAAALGAISAISATVASFVPD